jgi:hypothetical protein
VSDRRAPRVSAEAVIALSAGGTAVGALLLFSWRKIVLPLLHVVGLIRDLMDAFNGQPEQRDKSGALIEEARPGLIATNRQLAGDMVQVQKQLAFLDMDLQAVKAQVFPNSGSSNYDQSKRAADAAETVATVVTQVAETLASAVRQ